MVRVLILSDNKVVNLEPRGLKAEWGFSALIETSEVVLFDTGQNNIAFENFMLLKCKNPSKLILSHGHYDHTGGLMQFLKNLEISEVYAHPDVFSVRYYRGRYIGIPFKREQIESYAKIIEHKEPVEVVKDVWALGEIPRKYEAALLQDAYIMRGDKKEFDEIRDDQSIAIKTDKGLLLILGCCHAGIRNTVEYAEEVVGDEVKFVIGGTHLIAFKEQKLKEIVDWLKKKVNMIAPCHCTGLENEFLLMKEFVNRFRMIGSGSVIEI